MFKIGDTVKWNSQDGIIYGVITDINSQLYPVEVFFCDDGYWDFTLDGRRTKNGPVVLELFKGEC